jgi:hypothetical protein
MQLPDRPGDQIQESGPVLGHFLNLPPLVLSIFRSDPCSNQDNGI